MSPLYWAMVTLTLKGEKSSFKGSWSDLRLTWSKIDDTAVGLQKQCTASQGISGQHNCQPGGPDKHRHKMCHLWLDGCTCGAMWLDVHWERDKGPLYFHSSSLKEGQRFLPHTQCWGGMKKAVATSGSQLACWGDVHLVKLGSASSSKKKQCHRFPEV